MSGGWTVVDANTNKSQPITGKTDSGATSPYFNPAPGAQDPVGKMRVSEPQALIDTDFEYGQQPTKWESISLQNNRQSCYYIPQQPLTVTGITGAGTTTVTITGTFVVPANSLIYIQNALDSNANGWWYTLAGGTNTMTVLTSSIVAAGAQFNAALTYVYRGFFYSSCGIQVGANAFTTDGSANVTCTTTNPHGLSAGSLVYIVGTTSSGTVINGAQVVVNTTTANSFTFANSNGAVAAAAITNSAGLTTVFARPAGYVESRSFDGGVAFSAGAAVPNSQMIRQTRRYFRYQSGKGLQFSTGTSMCPPIFTTGVTSSGNVATVTTRFAHNLAVGATIQVTGAEQGTYNGTFTIATVPTPTTLTYVMGGIPSVSPATGLLIKVSAVNWFGSSNRVGFFDQQNGLYFEYDGQMLYAVWRNSINQLNGTIAVTQGSSVVTGTGTQFSAQLKPGDFTVIRGQTYRVVSIASDTSMFISPEYRGTTIAGALLSKTIDLRVPRTQWADPLDGTGPSGFTLDITKMQMWYIDYSWYGAGFIRWGLRTAKGQISYVHQQFNNNQRFEAYMRSGNLAAHYESNGVTPVSFLTSTLGTGGAGTIINVDSTAGFAPAGTLRIQAAGQTGAVEHISYTNRTASTFTVVARAQTGGSGSAQTFTYSATAPVLVEYASPDTNASLSHWGSSVIMDGRYDDDKSLIFNYGTTAPITTTSTTPIVIMAIRLAPAVDNGTVGLLGAKEIINRSQLQLDSLGLYTTGTGYLINLILNGFASGVGFAAGFVAPVQQTNGITSSLSQIAVNAAAINVTGGESVFAAYSNTTGNTTLNLSTVRDLGNSILGGGTSNTVPTSQAGFYPDGPDILYIVATPLTATSSTILARLNWKEAQA